MTKKILLADDSITIQKVVELTFSTSGYEVICTSKGTDVPRLIDETRPDIALLDVVMPDGDGYALCEQIKSNPDTGWIPVILLAGTFEPYDQQRAVTAGTDGHMKKPFESKALHAEVDRLLAAHPRPGQEPEEEPENEPVERVVPVVPAAEIDEPSGDTGTSTVAAEQSEPEKPSLQVEVDTTPVPEPVVPSGDSPAGSDTAGKSPEDLRKAARSAVEEIAERIVREIAWEVIPDLTEAIVKKRIRELEEEVERQAQS